MKLDAKGVENRPDGGIGLSFQEARISGRDIGSYNINITGSERVNVGCNDPDERPSSTKIARWPRVPSVDYKAIHDRVFSARTESSGKWFFDSLAYQEWVEGKVKSLECVGPLGAGKTSLVSAIVEDLQARSRSTTTSQVVLYAYLSHDTQVTQDVAIVLANLLSQVVQKSSRPSAEVLELHKEYAPHETFPRSDKIIQVLRIALSQFRMAFIIVDALDEYSVDDYVSSHELVEQLQRLNVQVLITSRHPIQFKPGTFSQLPIHANIEDIQLFIQEQIKGRLKTCTERSPGLLEEIMDKISGKCQGMFLIARLLLDWISRLRTPNEIRKAISSLPSGLNETYALTMGRVTSQSPDTVKLALQILAWVFYARRPISVSELQHIIAFESIQGAVSYDDLVDKDDIISACCGLVVFENENWGLAIAHFLHFSTQVFFQQHADEYFLGGERHITETCLRYLAVTASLLPQSFAPWDASTDKTVVQISIDEILRPFWFYHYAGREWPDHALAVNESFDYELVSDFFRYPSSPYLCHYLDGSSITPSAGMSPQGFQVLFFARHGLTSLLERHLTHMESLGEMNVDITDQLGRTGTQLSATYGYYSTMQILFERGANLNLIDVGGKSALHCAAFAGDPGPVKALVERGADPSMRDKSFQTPLHHAISAGHADVVRVLLDAGVNPTLPDKNGDQALHSAVTSGHVDVVRVFLETGTNPTHRDHHGMTPLHRAASLGHLDIVKELLKSGIVDPNIKDKRNETPLHCAVSAGYSRSIVQALLKNGADANIRDSSNEGPIHHALRAGQQEMVGLLLENGADLTVLDQFGQSPLLYAISAGYVEITRMIFSKVINTSARHQLQEGESPLHCAVRTKHPAVVKVILELGMDLNCTDMYLRTSLHHAAYDGSPIIARLLVKKGAKIDLQDLWGRTALHCAAFAGHLAIVGMMLHVKANPNIQDKYGETPLHCAAYTGHLDTVRILLKNGASPNVCSASWSSSVDVFPFDNCTDPAVAGVEGERRNFAMEHGYSTAMTALLAQLMAGRHKGRGGGGLTPLNYATLFGHSEIVKVLMTHGAKPNTPDDFGMTMER